jgi:Flp pilus assembly protein TadG
MAVTGCWQRAPLSATKSISERRVMKTPHLSLASCLDRFCRDEGGVSAVEFAVLLPLMLTLYLGTVEISQAVGIDRKVTLTSRTVADLASQSQTLTSSDMSNILNASATVILPYDSTKLKVTVSEITIDSNSNPTITWSCTQGGTAHGVGSAVAVPSALKVANTSLIWGEASYSYRPTIGYVITGTLNLSDQIYMAPRLGSTVSASC